MTCSVDIGAFLSGNDENYLGCSDDKQMGNISNILCDISTSRKAYAPADNAREMVNDLTKTIQYVESYDKL